VVGDLTLSDHSEIIPRAIPDPSQIAFGDIHVWRFEISEMRAIVEDLEKELTADERSRADRFRFEKDRESFVSTRGGLRLVLGRYLKEQPRRVRIAYGTYGKPELAGNLSSLFFNVSHSGGRSLVAISKGSGVGVDVESLDFELDRPAMVSVLSEREVRQLANIEQSKVRGALFKCWTSKEAYIKGLGLGLTAPLTGFDVCVDPDKPAQLLKSIGGEAGNWSLHLLDEGQAYSAVLATTCRFPRMLFFEGSRTITAQMQ
jgi:4'-phosphopantetheinyl transferase